MLVLNQYIYFACKHFIVGNYCYGYLQFPSVVCWIEKFCEEEDHLYVYTKFIKDIDIFTKG